MNYTVLYFARYRELRGTEKEVVTGEFASVDALREFLILQGDRGFLDDERLMCARNQEMCTLGEPLYDGDEVAFFPTVTGG